MTGYVTGIIHITVHFDKTKGRETQRSLQPKMVLVIYRTNIL